MDCASNSFRVEWDRAPASPEWDDFVECSPDGHHEQTALWGQVRSQLGWQVGRLLIREQGRIIAGAQVQTRPLGRLGRWAYITYGPCVSREDAVLEATMISELTRRVHSLGVHFLIVGLPYAAHRLVPRLTAAGFHYKPWRMPPNFLQATAVLDLTLSPEQLLSRMRRRTRRNVREALTRGIRVSEANSPDLEVFHQLMVSICRRRGISPNPGSSDFFIHLWDVFRPKGWVRMFFGTQDTKPVCAGLAFTFGDWFRVWKVGWSGEHGNLKPNEALWWEMIQWARNKGFRHFDFVEVNPDRARAIIKGEAAEMAVEDVTAFKLGFGGEIKLLPGAYYYVFNPLYRIALRFGLARGLGSPLALKLAKLVGR